MRLPRDRFTTRRLMVWGIVAATWLAVVRAYLVASRRVHRHGQLRWYCEAGKERPLTKSETEDAARLIGELSEAER